MLFPIRSLVVIGSVALFGLSGSLAAAEADFVGMLAVAIEDDVAGQLELTPGQKEKLLKLIEAREQEALELAIRLKDLSAAERAERLTPFRRQSESKGLAVLDPKQRVLLERIHFGRTGLAALAEPKIAGQLKLTDEQKTKVAEILRHRAEKLAEGGKKTAHIVRAAAERELAALLTKEQQTAWEGLTTAATPEAEKPIEVAAADTAEKPVDSATPAKAEKPSGAAAPVEVENPFEAGLIEPKTASLPDEPAEEEPAEEEPAEEEAAEEEPAAEPEDDAPVAKKDVKLRFNFRFQPWKDVLDWFAQQADLSLVLDAPPQGTFNYSDTREYTPAEAIDLLNSVLLTKGYTLVRRGRMLMLINLEDGIPPNLVSTIPMEDLDKKGEFELVSVLFSLNKLSSEEAETEINKLIGPQGTVVSLPKSRQILVTETAGRLRAIRSVIQRVEDPQGLAGGQLQSYELKYALPADVTAVMRQLLDIPEDKNVSSDGSIRFAMDPFGSRLLVTGKPDMLIKVDEIIKAVDVAAPGDMEMTVQEVPQLEVYSVTTADPQSVLAVMQTLMAGQPDVRLAIDEKTGNLVALARPSQHATIKATLDQMQRDARLIEVIHLRVVDPQLAVLSINKLFGGTEEESAKNAPKVDADPTTRQLLVRGTESQIEQIRSLLNKMGETETDEMAGGGRGNVRMLPLTGRSAHSALERMEEIWPTMHKNRIRIVTPSASIPAVLPGSSGGVQRKPELPGPSSAPSGPGFSLPPGFPLPAPPGASQPKTPPAVEPPSRENSAGLPHRPRFLFAAQHVETKEETAEEADGAKPQSAEEKDDAKPQTAEETDDVKPQTAAEKPVSAEPAPIIVAVGPGGVMIASEDTDALDDFEDLLTALASSAMAGSSEITIFYLKHAKAQVVAETLDAIFGGGTITTQSSSGGGGGGGLLGGLAGAAMGDSGGILGTLLGMGDGGTIAPSGSIQITPDDRLNALIVQANPTDLSTIEELLKILDQKESPEDVLVQMKARVIRCYNTQASEIADILKQVYRERMVSGASGASARRPTPQEFMQMLRGGRRGSSGGSSRTSAQEFMKMTVSVDERTNSLIVAAPEQLFEEVKMLVEQLDQAAMESGQSTRVVTLHKASPDAVQQALSAMLGDSVQFGKTTPAVRAVTPSRPSTQRPTAPSRPSSTQPRPSSSSRRPSSSSSRGTSRPPSNSRLPQRR